MTESGMDAFREIERRVAREIRKAGRKYGERALDPGGDPTRDVTDYALNELVGLIRYADMIEARARRMPADSGTYPGKTLGFARELRSTAASLGRRLVVLRDQLHRADLLQGTTEYPEDGRES